MVLPAPPSTRLLTIIAHVDHGKTTLADSLIASNGIISERLAGTLRYLDSDAEEQRRGITMKASGIGLRYRRLPLGGGGNNKGPTDHTNMVIHLHDSPGHVDFSVEVASSLLLSDAALLVVDAVEGPCARTHSLLREAYAHELVPILVINKVDRLCCEMGLSVEEAYLRIRGLVESVNAVCASMVQTRALEEEDNEIENEREEKKLESSSQDSRGMDNEKTTAQQQQQQQQRQEGKESVWNFDPIKGNVVFASALHGWGFTLPTLARSLFKSKTIPIKPPLLRQYLFGDYKYKHETGKVLKWKHSQSHAAASGGGEPMFAEFALRPLWEVYEHVSMAACSLGIKSELFSDGRYAQYSSSNGSRANAKGFEGKITATTSGMDQVLSSIQVGSTSPSLFSTQSVNNMETIPHNTQEMQELLSRTGASTETSVLSTILRRYRPLSDAVLESACDIGPSPAEASRNYRKRALALRIPQSMPDTAKAEFAKIQEAVRRCDTSDAAPTVAHVCKFASVPRFSVTDSDLPSVSMNHADAASTNMIMGVARVLSGTLRTDDVEYYTFGPRYDWKDDVAEKVPKQRIRCYLLMGSSFVKVDCVPAGHVCAIYNLEQLQLKTVTLCDKLECMPLRGFDFGLQPLVKVNVEPVLASDTETLERGLLKLSVADASVEVSTTSKGERILACLGEIHLERCILDLETVYCDHNIKLRISDPITSFCETTEWFENEHDFDSFFVDSAPPLRQATIPPYCDEEGLGNANRGRCRAILSGRGAAIGVRVIPLPRSVYECLKSKSIVDGSEDDLMTVGKGLKCHKDESMLTPQIVLDVLTKSLNSMDGNGNALIESSALFTGASVKAVHSSNGEVYTKTPKQESSSAQEYDNKESTIPEGYSEYQIVQSRIRNGLAMETTEANNHPSTIDDADIVALKKWQQDMRGSAVAGFQLAMRAGPLCEEPVRGVAVILESVEIAVVKKTSGGFVAARDVSSGMVVAALRTGIRCAVITRPARLVESHLRLTLHSSLAGLGALHAILSKRRGKVVTDTMVDGTDLIRITATIPQAESFGLAPELLKKSSGEVTAPELVFSHWAVLDEDPFWIPTTEEEREDYGEILMSGDLSTGLDNNALKYIRMVRSRKGLLVDSSKIIVAAEKQRTLSRKK
ncbi:hypothetical protein HJC23_004793 [Cyclotella cryptica]|uniref:Tr-type G domain-containing protein n=1 Tax=Cyclotella cryptica TaxID=29204 RepID=A0ABD3PXV3_9STRA|eukprot:CCRYP_010421-RA/>CCRYP_010421-RA protein AED:0.01 eAED:0.01 QI:298/1/1/1/1/1/4/1217/1148